MISCGIRQHYAELSEEEVRKCMRPNILSCGFRYERDQIRREVKHAVGIKIGVPWIDRELRVDVARRCRRAIGSNPPNYGTPMLPLSPRSLGRRGG